MGKRVYRNREDVREILERLSVPLADGCWAWLGGYDKRDYGKISYRVGPQKRVWRKAANVAWELHNAKEIPDDLEASHVCKPHGNSWCVNPNHLVVETHSENLKRRRQWRTALNCKHCGKPKEAINNSSNPYGREWACRSCRAERAAQWREKNPGYQARYDVENRDRINANRRDRRLRGKLERARNRRMQLGDEPKL
jgi:hypothetical protein